MSENEQVYLTRDYTVAVQMGETDRAEQLAAELTERGWPIPDISTE